MLKSRWTVRKKGFTIAKVGGVVTQVYLIAEARECLYHDKEYDSFERKHDVGDDLAVHLRNVIINELNFLDLSFFDDKKYCDKVSEKFPLYFEVYQDEEGDFHLDDSDDLLNALRFAAKDKVD